MKRKNEFILISFWFFLLLNCDFLKAQNVEPIQFKADQVEYNYKKENEEIICQGNAQAERSDFFLKAVVIQIYGKNRNFLKAYNKVKLINKTNNTVITGDYAEYNNTNSYAKFFKSPKLVQTNQHLVIESAVMESYISENRSIALGDVVIIQTNYIAYCEKGEYFQNQDFIELTGNPVVYQKKDKFEAKKIVIYIKKKLIKLYDDVYARIVSEPKEEKKELNNINKGSNQSLK